MLITRVSLDTFIGNGNEVEWKAEKRVILWPRTDADKGIKFVSAIKTLATSLSIWPITQIKVHTLLGWKKKNDAEWNVSKWWKMQQNSWM